MHYQGYSQTLGVIIFTAKVWMQTLLFKRAKRKQTDVSQIKKERTILFQTVLLSMLMTDSV